MAAPHAPAFGATIQPSTPTQPRAPAPGRLGLTVPAASPSVPSSVPSSIPTTPRTADAAAAETDDDDPPTPAASPHPLSAFYSHPTTRTSLEQLHTTSTANLHRPSPSRGGGTDDLPPLPGNPYAHAHGAPGSVHKTCLLVSGGDGGAGLSRDPSANDSGDVEKGDAVWPRPCHVAQRRGRPCGKRARVCRPLERLSPRMRFTIKVLLALFIVGAATGLGIGISKAAGVGVWKNQNSQTAIGE